MILHSGSKRTNWFILLIDNNVRYMYTSVPGEVGDCSEFICGIYDDIAVSCAH